MNKLTPEQIAEAASLTASGERSIRSLARDYGVDESSLRRALKNRPDGLSQDVDDDLPEEIPVIFRDYSSFDHLYVYPLGDVHKGAKMHNRKLWRQWLSYLEDAEDTSLLTTGDLHNSAIVGSKSDVYEEVMTVGEARRELRGELAPMAQKGRLDLLMPGNHEYRILRAVGIDPIQDLADDLLAPYARSAAVVVYHVGEVVYEFYVRHGTGNGQSLTVLAKGAMVVPTADVILTAHTHRQAVYPDDFFYRAGDRMERRHRYYVSSGSFLAYESYAAERGYAPTRLGAPRIYLDGRRRDVHVSV